MQRTARGLKTCLFCTHYFSKLFKRRFFIFLIQKSNKQYKESLWITNYYTFVDYFIKKLIFNASSIAIFIWLMRSHKYTNFCIIYKFLSWPINLKCLHLGCFGTFFIHLYSEHVLHGAFQLYEPLSWCSVRALVFLELTVWVTPWQISMSRRSNANWLQRDWLNCSESAETLWRQWLTAARCKFHWSKNNPRTRAGRTHIK